MSQPGFRRAQNIPHQHLVSPDVRNSSQLEIIVNDSFGDFVETSLSESGSDISKKIEIQLTLYSIILSYIFK